MITESFEMPSFCFCISTCFQISIKLTIYKFNLIKFKFFKNKEDGQLYACKIIKKHDDFNGHEQMLLMRESLILHKLKHPGIVEFKGVNFQSFTDPNKLEPSLKTFLDQEKKRSC